MLNKELKETLYINLKPIYDRAQPKLNKEEIMERIEVFSMVLSFASGVPEKNLNNLENDIVNLLESISKLDILKIDVTDATKRNLIEIYLKLLYFLIDEREFYRKNIHLVSLGKLYRCNRLDILNTINHPERNNYYNILFSRNENGYPFLYGDSRHPERVLKDDIEILPFVEAYCFRNMLREQLNMKAKWEHFLCMFYTMIETTYKHKEEIISLKI